ncbi:unnamed protein product [Schistosoma curassoni]|uniref:RWP-RK domain-containing protein n=1 Tax=Schistosoma curassoni TaxID=6186 RepID=A0A183K7G6_9TREM|nr:unnamed protein product [Schistosoma curassoni]
MMNTVILTAIRDADCISNKNPNATIPDDESNIEVMSNNHGCINLGPKRRFTVGSDVDGASTLMYRATQLIKRSRRKFLSLTELRRFGRHPWFDFNVGLHSQNGLHPVSSNLKKKSHAVTTNSTTETDLPNPGIVTSSSSAH